MEITVFAFIVGHYNWGLIPWTFKEKDLKYYDFINSSKIDVRYINYK